MGRKIRRYNSKKEEKLKEQLEKDEKEKRLKEEKDLEMKPFSLQSAFWIIVSSVIGSWLIPLLLTFVGIKANVGILIGNTFFTSFGFTWVRHFIDSKKGFSKSFWKQYIIFGIIFGVISYFWLFRKNYI